MSEQPTPRVAENSAGAGGQALTPEKIDNILADFRSWLEQVASAVEPPQVERTPETVSLHTLISQFVALRQEVNLQTRSVRSQQEQNAEGLKTLEQALESLRAAQLRLCNQSEEPDEEQLRPLLKTLLDVTDLMSLAGREVQRLKESLTLQGTRASEQIEASQLPQSRLAERATSPASSSLELLALLRLLVPPDFDAVMPPQRADANANQGRRSFLSWLIGRGKTQHDRDATADTKAAPTTWQQREHLRRWLTEHLQNAQTALRDYDSKLQAALAAEQARSHESLQAFNSQVKFVESVFTGYTMSLQRLERTLDQFGLEPIVCEGEDFDPETMEVVDAVSGTGLPAGEVVQEVRRGYLWRGRLFRFAQVKVAKS